MKLRYIKFLDIFLVLILSLFCFSLFITLIYNGNIKLIEKLSNNFYDENALFFTISEKEVEFNSLYAVLPENTVLYNTLPIGGKDVRGIIYKGKYDQPALKEGRCFSENDFLPNSYLAMIGNDVDISKIEDGKKYIEFNGHDYEVIGVIGYSMPTKLDQAILLTMNVENINLSNRYVISSPNIQNSFDFLGNEPLFGQVVVRDQGNVNILHLIDRTNNQIITSVIFLTVLFINTISILLFWIKRKETEIQIKRNNGYSRTKIICDICKEFSKMLAISVLITIIGSCFFSDYMQNTSLLIQTAMISIAIILVTFSSIILASSYLMTHRRWF